MHVWAVNVYVQLQLLSDGLDVPETFLIVGTGTTNPYLDLVLD